MMTKQEIFDKVACHLLRQNKRSVLIHLGGISEICAYRSREGLSCAIGCLIPDESYHPSMEGKNVYLISKTFKEAPPAFDRVNLDFLSVMQEVHDCGRPTEWVARLAYAAALFELNGDVLRFHFAFPAVKS